MRKNKQSKNLSQLETLIKRSKTGTATDLAIKLNVSRRTLFYYLGLLREKGHNINFCRIRKTYFLNEK